jgi:protein arginine kinase activator
MRCGDCGNSEAEVHLTAVEADEVKSLHLCPACAARRGFPTEPGDEAPESQPPLVDFLAQLGAAGPAAPTPSVAEPCPFCGTSTADFRKTGRVGCPQCYVHFEAQLRGLLRRIHGSAQHAGKLYLSETSDISDRLGRISSMKRRLRRAIEAEDFEQAADLRDRIHELEVQE